MTISRILVVAAHPDDEVLGCGASIAKWQRQGAKIRILVLGEGTSCRFSREDVELKTKAIALERSRRHQQFGNAMASLKIDDYSIGHGTCGRFDTQPLIDFTKLIEGHIEQFKPQMLLTHSRKDANNDHRITFDSSIIATRPTPNQPVKKVVSFEIPSSTEWSFTQSFNPNYFIDVSDTIQDKLDAFSCYAETESRPYPFPRSNEALLALAKYRGSQTGVLAAEAFELIRSIDS